MIGFGLLGCGRIAKRHADLLSKGAIAKARLAAVCDSAPEVASQFSTAYGVPVAPSLDALLAMKDVDVVSILTPSGLHAEQAIAVAKAGKHVIVEKPMALQGCSTLSIGSVEQHALGILSDG